MMTTTYHHTSLLGFLIGLFLTANPSTLNLLQKEEIKDYIKIHTVAFVELLIFLLKKLKMILKKKVLKVENCCKEEIKHCVKIQTVAFVQLGRSCIFKFQTFFTRVVKCQEL